MSTSAQDVAEWLVWQTGQVGEYITHLKLQKMLYFAQAWHLVLTKAELFPEDFQAWTHGPVIPEVFFKYREHGYNPLPIPEQEPRLALPPESADVLKQVFDVYFEFPARKLVEMSHDLPWNNARGGLPAEARCEVIIPKEAIRGYFLEKYKQDLT